MMIAEIFASLFQYLNAWMLIAFVVAFALQVLITQFGGAVFGTCPLGIVDWLKIVGTALSVIALEEIVKLFSRLYSKCRA